MEKKCPICQSELISVVLTSNPPQYKTYCPKCGKYPMSNSMQCDNCTPREKRAIKVTGDVTNPRCAECGKEVGVPMPKPFNDLPAKDQKEIIRGAMKHAKKLQDEVLQNDYIGSRLNDWKTFPDLKYSRLAGYDVQLIIDWKRKAVADARKEVMWKVWDKAVKTKKGVLDLFPDANIKLPSEELALQVLQKNAYNKAIDDVLATLREEEGT